MPRPRIADDFTPFFDWMRNTRRCSPGVAKAYTSYMRRLYRDIDGNILDQEIINDYFARAYDADDSYAKVRSAWSMYVEYNLVEKQTQLPQPQPVSLMLAKQRNRPLTDNRVPALTSAVRSALRVLESNHISVHQIFHLRWLHVALGEMNNHLVTHIRTPNKNTMWLIPSTAIRALWDYAAVGTNLSLPLVPREPGSDVPYPYTALRREIGIYTEEELKGLLEQKPDGSALGSALVRNQIKEVVEDEPHGLTTYDVLDMLKAPVVKKQKLLFSEDEEHLDDSFGDEDDEP